MRDAAPQVVHLRDYSPPAFRISTVALDVHVGTDEVRVRSRLTIARNPEAKAPAVPVPPPDPGRAPSPALTALHSNRAYPRRTPTWYHRGRQKRHDREPRPGDGVTAFG